MDNDQLGFLHQEITARLARMDGSVAWYRHRHVFTKSSTIALSALITILSGITIAGVNQQIVSAVVLILGALISVINAWGAFFSPKESWLLNAEAYSKLRALEFRLSFEEKGNPNRKDDLNFLTNARTEYQQIMDAYNKRWQELRTSEKIG